MCGCTGLQGVRAACVRVDEAGCRGGTAGRRGRRGRRSAGRQGEQGTSTRAEQGAEKVGGWVHCGRYSRQGVRLRFAAAAAHVEQRQSKARDPRWAGPGPGPSSRSWRAGCLESPSTPNRRSGRDGMHNVWDPTAGATLAMLWRACAKVAKPNVFLPRSIAPCAAAPYRPPPPYSLRTLARRASALAVLVEIETDTCGCTRVALRVGRAHEDACMRAGMSPEARCIGALRPIRHRRTLETECPSDERASTHSARNTDPPVPLLIRTQGHLRSLPLRIGLGWPALHWVSRAHNAAHTHLIPPTVSPQSPQWPPRCGPTARQVDRSAPSPRPVPSASNE